MRQRTAMIALLIIAGLLQPSVARATSRAEGPLGSREKYFTPRIGDKVPPELTFQDEAGNTVRLGDYFGSKPVILVPAYYRCPMLCTLVLNDLIHGLRGVPATPGKDFEVVVVSFDPREKPSLAKAKKASYMEEYARPGTENGWHFLTGEQKAIDQLLDAIGFRIYFDEKKDQFVHARGILVLNPGGTVSRYFLDGDYPSRTLRLGLREASEGKVGSMGDQILLMCYQYDPATGKYSASVLFLIRVGAVLTLLGIMTFWFVSWRRPRPQAAGATVTVNNETGEGGS
jgi:protein SCO1